MITNKNASFLIAAAVLFLHAPLAVAQIGCTSGKCETQLVSSVYSICATVPAHMNVVIYQHVDTEVVNFAADNDLIFQSVIDPYPSQKFAMRGSDWANGLLKNNKLRLFLLAVTYSDYVDAYYSFSPLIREEARGEFAFIRVAYSIEECKKCDYVFEQIIASMHYCSGVSGEIHVGSSPIILPPFKSAKRD